ncbi:MAG: hypothetical protein WB723_17920 [Candidatus Acidiferrales bacterium]
MTKTLGTRAFSRPPASEPRAAKLTLSRAIVQLSKITAKYFQDAVTDELKKSGRYHTLNAALTMPDLG